MDTCVYFHINLIKQEIFYVGIGNKKRPYSKSNRSKWWQNISIKYGYNVVIIHENLSWIEACELETKYINQIGRLDLGKGTLINMTDGGDGISNASIETKLKISESKLGEKNPMFGKITSDEVKKKLRDSQLGEKHWTFGKGPMLESTKKKISKTLTGTHLSIECKNKISEALQGKKRKPFSAEHKRKMSESHKGKTYKT